jgi:hypothetical protein
MNRERAIECENCQTTSGCIETVFTDDGRKPLLCEDCADELRRVERLADELAAKPSCEFRQAIIDRAETTEGLVNALRAHDLVQCIACASTARTVADDRLLVNLAAVCCEGMAVSA